MHAPAAGDRRGVHDRQSCKALRAALDRHHQQPRDLARARRDAVDLAELAEREAVLAGDAFQGIAAPGRVGLPGHQRPVLVLLQVFVEGLHLVRRQHDAGIDCAADQRPAESGIERHELVHRDLGQLGREQHVDVARLVDGREVRLVRNGLQDDAVRRRAGDQVFQRLQLGHVAARLPGHRQAHVVGGLALPAVLLDRAPDRVLAPVVGGEREMPVAVDVVDVLQIIERGTGRGDDVAAAVVPPVLLEFVALSGARDELPQARGVGARVGQRVERALDDRQQGDLGGQAAFFQLVDDVVQVQAAAVEHAREVVLVGHVPRGVPGHLRRADVGHGETVAQALPQVGGRFGAVEPGDALGLREFALFAIEGRQLRRVAQAHLRQCRRRCGRNSGCGRRYLREGRRGQLDRRWRGRRGVRRNGRAGLQQQQGRCYENTSS